MCDRTACCSYASFAAVHSCAFEGHMPRPPPSQLSGCRASLRFSEYCGCELEEIISLQEFGSRGRFDPICSRHVELPALRRNSCFLGGVPKSLYFFLGSLVIQNLLNIFRIDLQKLPELFCFPSTRITRRLSSRGVDLLRTMTIKSIKLLRMISWLYEHCQLVRGECPYTCQTLSTCSDVGHRSFSFHCLGV